MGRVERVLFRWRRRVVSERGSVGVVMAIVMFLVLGMLTMTWNTAQLSKAKMRLQNAADSAALAHAVWQARGMNTVQNINDEMYESLSLAVRLYAASEVMVVMGTVLAELAVIPIVGAAFYVAALALFEVSVYVADAGWWLAMGISDMFLKTLEVIYAKMSGVFGVWNAQQLAAQNEADPLASLDWGSTADADGSHIGIYSVGMSSLFIDTYVLPLGNSSSQEVNSAPWKVTQLSFLSRLPEPFKSIGNLLGAIDGWCVTPYASRRVDGSEGLVLEDGRVTDDSVLPSPTMWIAFKKGKNIETLPIDGFWNPGDSKRWSHDQPMYAVAAAQCITGDVVPHSRKYMSGGTNQRPAGFGTGATAKLVPVAEVFHRMDKSKASNGGGMGPLIENIIYH